MVVRHDRKRRIPHLPFEGAQQGFIALPLFDFKFTKTLDDRAVFHDRNMVDCKLSQRGSPLTHHKAASPHPERHDRSDFAMPQVENQEIAQRGRRISLSVSHFYFLPIVPSGILSCQDCFPVRFDGEE